MCQERLTPLCGGFLYLPFLTLPATPGRIPKEKPCGKFLEEAIRFLYPGFFSQHPFRQGKSLGGSFSLLAGRFEAAPALQPVIPE